MTAPAQPMTTERALAVAGRLADILESENEALRANRQNVLARTIDVKSELAEAYQNEMDELRRHPEIVKSCPPQQLAALRDAGVRLNKELENHRRLVVAARTVTERMLKAVADEVNKARKPVRGYDRTANFASRNAIGSKPAALAYHEVV